MSSLTFENPQYLFVYGTLRNSYTRLPKSRFRTSPPEILVEGMQWKGTAKLKGYLLYDLGRYPGVVPNHSDSTAETVVHGDVFVIDNAMFPVFDEYENIADEFSHPQEYNRIKRHVDIYQDGKWQQIPTWVYEFNWPLSPQYVLIQNGDYVDYCSRKDVGQ